MSEHESWYGRSDLAPSAQSTADRTGAAEDALADELPEIVPAGAVQVRESRCVFRLIAAADGRSGRQVTTVAADSEDEARRIAFFHDPFGRDWRNPAFAIAESVQTTETHVHGDLVFRSEPAARPETCEKKPPRRTSLLDDV